MNNIFTFERYQDRWFIVLPEWEGDKDDLEMVMGADMLLDIMSEDEHQIKVKITTEYFSEYQYHLKFDREEFDGAWYTVDGRFGTNFECWLYAVTTFVFNEFPKEFYFRKVGYGS